MPISRSLETGVSSTLKATIWTLAGGYYGPRTRKRCGPVGESDDLAIYRRIVVLRRATEQRLIYDPLPRRIRTRGLCFPLEKENVGRFPTLRAALDHIRSVMGKRPVSPALRTRPHA